MFDVNSFNGLLGPYLRKMQARQQRILLKKMVKSDLFYSWPTVWEHPCKHLLRHSHHCAIRQHKLKNLSVPVKLPRQFVFSLDEYLFSNRLLKFLECYYTFCVRFCVVVRIVHSQAPLSLSKQAKFGLQNAERIQRTWKCYFTLEDFFQRFQS